ncbi:beta-glucosidase [Roseateles terrae]|nr:beta-glucosidase [Roseateles terrae]
MSSTSPTSASQPFGYQSPFPPHFVLGVSASAPQIEGAAFTDGKGFSNWDHFARQPGTVLGGDTLDVAVDHYHRFDEDFALMASMGVRDYRLSIAWPRIHPDGGPTVNQAGIDFYHRLFASMKRHGITPWVTLFHWDLPLPLEARGGWTSRETVDAFGRYAETVVKAFSGAVKHWITLNEIRCFTVLAYGQGIKAPGRKEPEAVVNQTIHHALVCHGLAVRAVRQWGGEGARVGLTDNSDVCVPVTETPADIAAATAWFRDRNAHILGAMHAGHYPEHYLRRVGKAAPKVAEGDFALIHLPTDFLGMNIYTGHYVRAADTPDGYETLALPPAYPRADPPWLHLMPQSIYWAPRLAHALYGHSSLFITENGCGYDDEPMIKGEVQDLHRREYLRSHLREVHRAIADGVPLDGYFCWSFIDNFEWEDGYRRRFGLVHCDYQTLKRTPKLSARYYAQVIRERRVL